jgi:hypothetical protein
MIEDFSTKINEASVSADATASLDPLDRSAQGNSRVLHEKMTGHAIVAAPGGSRYALTANEIDPACNQDSAKLAVSCLASEKPYASFYTIALGTLPKPAADREG